MALPSQKKFANVLGRSQPHRVAAVWLILILGGAAAVAFPKEKRSEEANALFERARTVSGLEVEGGAPFRLDAVLYVRTAEGVVEGHYVLDWQSQHQWRDELTLPRYSQLRTGTESALWRQRNTNHQLLPALQFLDGLDLGAGHTEVDKRWSVTTAKGKGLVNPPRCAKIESHSSMVPVPPSYEWCFDSDSGVLTRKSWSDWDTTWEYLEYAPWNGKLYARRINIAQGGKRVVEAHITVTDAPKLEPGTFVPPEGAEEWPRCANARPATPASSDHQFLSGPGARRPLTPILVELGRDGHVQDVVVLRPLPSARQEQLITVDLKQRWSFHPATCDKVPIPFTMMFELPI